MGICLKRSPDVLGIATTDERKGPACSPAVAGELLDLAVPPIQLQRSGVRIAAWASPQRPVAIEDKYRAWASAARVHASRDGRSDGRPVLVRLAAAYAAGRVRSEQFRGLAASHELDVDGAGDRQTEALLPRGLPLTVGGSGAAHDQQGAASAVGRRADVSAERVDPRFDLVGAVAYVGKPKRNDAEIHGGASKQAFSFPEMIQELIGWRHNEIAGDSEFANPES
jgi:hypothetical protein